MAGDGQRLVGQVVKNKKKKINKKGETKKIKIIINITKSDILAILFYTISHARDSLRNS